MEIIRLENSHNAIFPQLCAWYYSWLGRQNGESMEEVRCTFLHSLRTEGLPQTYVALCGGEPAGMYQLAVSDDLNSRPDLYPWLINVYVDPKFRGQAVCRALMQTVHANALRAQLPHLYLYTRHIGLYEKFGWKFIGEVRTFKAGSPMERLYRLEVKSR